MEATNEKEFLENRSAGQFAFIKMDRSLSSIKKLPLECFYYMEDIRALQEAYGGLNSVLVGRARLERFTSYIFDQHLKAKEKFDGIAPAKYPKVERKEKSTKNTEPKFKTIKDLKSFNALYFKEGSQDMEHIDLLVKTYLQSLSDKYREEGYSQEEIQAIINENLKEYYDIIDYKRNIFTIDVY